MASFKTAVLGFSGKFFTILMQKIAFSLEVHNHSKQSCFIMAFFLSMSSEKKKRGEWEVFKPQPGAFARFFIFSFLFLPWI